MFSVFCFLFFTITSSIMDLAYRNFTVVSIDRNKQGDELTFYGIAKDKGGNMVTFQADSPADLIAEFYISVDEFWAWELEDASNKEAIGYLNRCLDG